MRLGVVLRSVAVMLAAPLLALPAGGAEEEVALRTSAPLPSVAPAGADSPLASQASHAQAQELRSSDPAKAAPMRVTVDCAEDGCVVQNGLDVLVVGP